MGETGTRTVSGVNRGETGTRILSPYPVAESCSDSFHLPVAESCSDSFHLPVAESWSDTDLPPQLALHQLERVAADLNNEGRKQGRK